MAHYLSKCKTLHTFIVLEGNGGIIVKLTVGIDKVNYDTAKLSLMERSP
jgi:hypothetical protein